jgi:hypothetical protein
VAKENREKTYVTEELNLNLLCDTDMISEFIDNLGMALSDYKEVTYVTNNNNNDESMKILKTRTETLHSYLSPNVKLSCSDSIMKQCRILLLYFISRISKLNVSNDDEIEIKTLMDDYFTILKSCLYLTAKLIIAMVMNVLFGAITNLDFIRDSFSVLTETIITMIIMTIEKRSCFKEIYPTSYVL